MECKDNLAIIKIHSKSHWNITRMECKEDIVSYGEAYAYRLEYNQNGM